MSGVVIIKRLVDAALPHHTLLLRFSLQSFDVAHALRTCILSPMDYLLNTTSQGPFILHPRICNKGQDGKEL